MSVDDRGCPETPAARVEAAFNAVAAGTMRDMPLNNPALCVEAVGFRSWEGHWLGALITPWAINLMLLPADSRQAPGVGGFAARRFGFPSGEYEFNAGWLDRLGAYRSCSLFSPPAEFPDQDSARAVALEIMAALFRPETEFEPTAAFSRRAFLRGNFGKARQVGRVSEA